METIYQASSHASKGHPMSIDKTAKDRAGAPAAAKKPEGERFDLFRNFRHPPKPADPSRAPATPKKPKE